MADAPPDRRARIAAAFDRAEAYDSAAIVQRTAADRLAARIAGQPLPDRPRILELGCGTGLLTEALHRTIGPARWTVSDIAPAMVERARRRSGIDADYRVIDGEAVPADLGPFDLIASNMAFHWFGDLPGALSRLARHLAPGGLIAFSTMAADSLSEWDAAVVAEGSASGIPPYPDADRLAAMAPAGTTATVAVEPLPEKLADARAFLRGLKTIGAGTATPGHRPLAPAALRRAMARFDAGPRIVTYRIGFCLVRAD
jgi:malonyl-CoA O-methyltransferase